MNWLAVVVGQGSGRRAVAAPLVAVALEALKFGKEFLPVLEAVQVDSGLRRHLDGIARLFAFEARRKRLDVGDEIGPLLVDQLVPCRHAGVDEASCDGVKKVFVSGQCPRGRGAAFKCRGNKIPRQKVEIWSIFAVAVPVRSVAAPAITVVQRFTRIGVPGPFSDVRFLGRGRTRGGLALYCNEMLLDSFI